MSNLIKYPTSSLIPDVLANRVIPSLLLHAATDGFVLNGVKLPISVVKKPDASETLTVNVSEVSVAVSSAALAADEPKVVYAFAPTDKVIASSRQRVKSFFIFIFLPFRNFFHIFTSGVIRYAGQE